MHNLLEYMSNYEKIWYLYHNDSKWNQYTYTLKEKKSLDFIYFILKHKPLDNTAHYRRAFDIELFPNGNFLPVSLSFSPVYSYYCFSNAEMLFWLR